MRHSSGVDLTTFSQPACAGWGVGVSGLLLPPVPHCCRVGRQEEEERAKKVAGGPRRRPLVSQELDQQKRNRKKRKKKKLPKGGTCSPSRVASEAGLPSFRSPTGELTVPCGAQVGHGSFVVYGTLCATDSWKDSAFAIAEKLGSRTRCSHVESWTFFVSPVSGSSVQRSAGELEFSVRCPTWLFDIISTIISTSLCIRQSLVGCLGRLRSTKIRDLLGDGFRKFSVLCTMLGSAVDTAHSSVRSFSTWQVDLGSWCAVRTWFLNIFSCPLESGSSLQCVFAA